MQTLRGGLGFIQKTPSRAVSTPQLQLGRDKNRCVCCVGAVEKQQLTFCVEGNSGAGKSTLLERIGNGNELLKDFVEFVPQLCDKWRDVEPEYYSIMDCFYDGNFIYHNDVFVWRALQRVEQERERKKESPLMENPNPKPLRLMERSIFTDRMVYLLAFHDANDMGAYVGLHDVGVYDSWFDPLVSSFPALVPDAFIYLRSTPEACHERIDSIIMDEGRATPKLDYLRHLHQKHDAWLLPSINNPASARPAHFDHPDINIRDRVFYLEGDHIHHTLKKVPALLLDNIDLTSDIEANREYARQVVDFFEFVKKNKKAVATNTNPSARLSKAATSGTTPLVWT